MGVTFVILYELDEGQNHQQAVQLIHSRLDSCGATREGNFQYESEVQVFQSYLFLTENQFYQTSDSKNARDFYTLKTTEYPATVFARVADEDKNKNTCMQCDKVSIVFLIIFDSNSTFQAFRKSSLQNSKFFLAKTKIRSSRNQVQNGRFLDQTGYSHQFGVKQIGHCRNRICSFGKK